MNRICYNYKNYLFPEDWAEYKLSQLLEVVERPVNMVDDQEYNLITIKRNFGGIESRGKLTGERILVKSQFEIREGDFIISKRQIVHGACAIVPKKYEGATVSNEYDVMNCNNRLLPSFFKYYVQLPFMRRYFYIASDGVHVEKLRFKTDAWLRQKIRIPSVMEQQSITSILTACDKVICLKEQLIAEKKKQKKWLMQNLLTGKKTLPGFKGEFREIRLGDIGNTYAGLSGKSKGDFGYGKYFIPYINVFENTVIDTKKLEFVNISENEKQNKVLYGDILFTSTSETQGEIGMSSVYLDNIDNVYLNSFCVGFRMNNFDTLLPEFACYYFRGSYFRSVLNMLAQGATRYNLSRSSLVNICVKVPAVTEQSAIAEILSTADREIELHKKQLDELKEQKKALMQLLLTGIVRVNTEKVN
ncbi:restriction endonuclease subunit S [Desulfoscipio sp. XC116]|uniref:restriction endonuclease subunit S n=1 Tax=Desulfoscipio sp. XC116 TaxID=3144975 RepID=UPI00325C2A24